MPDLRSALSLVQNLLWKAKLLLDHAFEKPYTSRKVGMQDCQCPHMTTFALLPISFLFAEHALVMLFKGLERMDKFTNEFWQLGVILLT